MKSVTDTILTGLRDPNKIAEDNFYVLLLAGEALAKHSMVAYNTAGVCPEVDVSDISAVDSKRIVDALLECYQATSCNNTRGGILYALGKTRDPAVVEFFRQQLVEFTKLLLLANGTVFQAMIGLNNLDEAILKGGGGVTDVEANLAEARRYLALHGTLLPW
ncbi:MAG: hypothetical protein V4819_02630 [Verrucomicrobiota bacterium]